MAPCLATHDAFNCSSCRAGRIEVTEKSLLMVLPDRIQKAVTVACREPKAHLAANFSTSVADAAGEVH